MKIDSFCLRLFKFMLGTALLGYAIGKKEDWAFILQIGLVCFFIVAIIKFIHLIVTIHIRGGVASMEPHKINSDSKFRLQLDYGLFIFILIILASLYVIGAFFYRWSDIPDGSFFWVICILSALGVIASLSRAWMSEQLDELEIPPRVSSWIGEVLSIILTISLLCFGYTQGDQVRQQDLKRDQQIDKLLEK